MTTREKGLLYALGAAILAWVFFRDGEQKGGFAAKRFVPYSDKAKELFRFAAVKAGLPEAWGDDPALHYILDKESKGWVGIPNYLFAHVLGKGIDTSARAADWPKAWEIIRLDEPSGKSRHPKFTSRASGLGQLQPSHVKAFYPEGLKGVGDPVNEAVGMLRYIASRYGSPEVARSVYGKGGKGAAAVPYTHAMTGQQKKKGHKEGY